MAGLNAKVLIKKIFENEESFGTELLILCLDQYGVEFFAWEPDSLLLQLQDDYAASMPTINRDKLWALVTAITTDLFYKSLETFIHTCNALSGSEVSFEVWDPAEPEEAGWGITEVFLNDPPIKEDTSYEFDDEIRRYLGVMLEEQGILTPPDILRIAIYNEDPGARADDLMADDPVMLNALWDRQREECGYIIRSIQERLAELVSRVQLLPLQHGNAAVIAQLGGKLQPAATQ